VSASEIFSRQSSSRPFQSRCRLRSELFSPSAAQSGSAASAGGGRGGEGEGREAGCFYFLWPPEGCWDSNYRNLR